MSGGGIERGKRKAGRGWANEGVTAVGTWCSGPLGASDRSCGICLGLEAGVFPP